MSIDYVKEFNFIPQVVVLAFALELGIDSGTCWALGAMYEQLRWAIKVRTTRGPRAPRRRTQSAEKEIARLWFGWADSPRVGTQQETQTTAIFGAFRGGGGA